MSIGILGYGSIVTTPGEEIERATVQTIDVVTPFTVEYARKSKGRAGAPTLVPVENELGAHVRGRIFVLRSSDVSKQAALDMLYRRELNKVGDCTAVYDDVAQREKSGAILLEELADFKGISIVLYASLEANLLKALKRRPPAKRAEMLAALAVGSVEKNTFHSERDGIAYLARNIAAGIRTPLTEAYTAAILGLANNASTLGSARREIARQKFILPGE